MSTGPTNLFDLATDVLDAALTAWPSAGLVAPSVAYVYGGASPVAMCDSVVVTYTRIFHGMPARADAPYPSKAMAAPRSVTLCVWCFRCLTDTLYGEGVQVSDSATVSVVNATADASTLMTDAYILPRAIVAAHAAGQIGHDYAGVLGIGDVVPLAASGGVGGCRFELSLELM